MNYHRHGGIPSSWREKLGEFEIYFMIRYLIAIITGSVSILALFLTTKFPSLVPFSIIVGIWFLFLLASYLYIFQKSKEKWLDLGFLFVSLLSYLSLVLLIENTQLKFFLILLSGVATAFLFFKSPTQDLELPHEKKIMRRGTVMIGVFNVYALVSMLFALSLYFQMLPFVIFTVLGIIIIFYFSIISWQSYLALPFRELALFGGVVALVMGEIIWVLHYLSLGYFVLGLICVWLWYNLMLLIRFNLTPDGIIWKKQWRFLGANVIILFLLLFFVVRWI